MMAVNREGDGLQLFIKFIWNEITVNVPLDFDIERVKGAKNILFGEGLFFAKLTGPGKVWIQTMPISKLAAAIIPFLPTNTGSDWDF